MPSTLLERLRTLPAAGAVLAALGGEPRRLGGRRGRARPAAGRRAERPRPRRRGRRAGRRAPRGRAARRRGAGPRALRHGDGARPPRATFDLAGARRESAIRGRARCRTSSSARRSQDDLARRDFTVNTIALRLADGELLGAPAARDGSRRARCCACCTTPRSATTRRGCCGWRATRPGSGSRSSPHTAALAGLAVVGRARCGR